MKPIKPQKCPYCRRYAYTAKGTYHDKCWYVLCPRCNTTGPSRTTAAAAAIKAWNFMKVKR